MSQISKLHYISMQTAKLTHLQAIAAVCRAGGEWIQLRIKGKGDAEVLEMAGKAREICDQYGAKLILNDFVEIARKINADGVHVGKMDMRPAKARRMLGKGAIIGGTANTLDDIRTCVSEGVDYLGVGPFRFTSTKQNLSPVLGKEGLALLVQKCRELDIDVPMIAIGGITEQDIPDIMETGVYGVAVAGSITTSENISETVQRFNEQLAYG